MPDHESTPTPSRRWGWAADVFGCDRRSLAVFRIAVGLILLADLALRAPYISAFYTDAGAFSRATCRDHLPWGFWSLYLLDGSASFQAGLFVIAAIAAALLLLGFQTRLMTIISWVLLVSLHARHPLLLNSGDTLLRMLLFWSMFLPLGSCWSLDAWRKNRRSAKNRSANSNSLPAIVLSGATFAIIMQLFMMYWFTGIAKWHPGWLEGGALGHVLRMDLLIKPAGKALLGYPQLLEFLSIATVWLEILGPLLLLIPRITPLTRIAMILAFFGLHLGIYASISVGLFSFISMIAWLPLIPTCCWELFSRGGNASAAAVCSKVATRDRVWLQPSGWPGALLAVFGLFLTLSLLVWNFHNLEGLAEVKQRPWAEAQQAASRLFAQNWLGEDSPYHLGPATPIRVLMAAQEFEMFGPVPQDNHWFVYRARLRNGEIVDLLTETPASDKRPEDPYAALPSHRWKKLHRNLMRQRFRKYAAPLADYFSRRWNATHGADQQVVEVELIAYVEPTAPDRRLGDFVEIRMAQLRYERPEEEDLDAFEQLLKQLEQGGSLLP